MLLGTELHNNTLVVIGSEAVVGLDMSNGSQQSVTSTDRVSQYSRHGNSLVLQTPQRNVQRVSLDSNTSSPVVRLGNDKAYFGHLTKGFAVDGNARQVIGVSEEGRLHGYLF